MDPLEIWRQTGVAGALALALLLIAISVYRMTPAYIERYKAETVRPIRQQREGGSLADALERLAVVESDLKHGGRRIAALEVKVDRLGENLSGQTAKLDMLDNKLDQQDERNREEHTTTRAQIREATTSTSLRLDDILDALAKKS